MKEELEHEEAGSGLHYSVDMNRAHHRLKWVLNAVNSKVLKRNEAEGANPKN